MEQWELTARVAIHATMAACNAAGDAGRLADFAACFAAAGRLEGGVVDARGRRSIVEQLSAVSATKRDGEESLAPVRHHLATVDIREVAAGSARASSYFSVLTRRGLDHWGRYSDRFVVEDGRWLIAHRRIVVDGHVPGGWLERVVSDV